MLCSKNSSAIKFACQTFELKLENINLFLYNKKDMSDNTIEEIKSRLDIVDVAKEYIELEKVGSNLRALCPFHAEQTPSFFISPSRQSWRCFGGCNEGGDIFDFIIKIEGVEFYEALKILAKKAGVDIKKRDPKKAGKREKFYEMYELTTKFFEKQLEASKKGKKAKKYLIDRGITEESIKKWRLGYSPDSWQALSKFLISKGHKREEIVEAGLAIKKEDHSYDRFRGRIMFPITNSSGRTIAFGGRIFGDSEDTAKYINSPQTPLYDKSKALYGLDKAKVEIRRQDRAILVEGYTDVIMVHQAGFKNVISTSGTALTGKQLNILSRYTQNLFTAFDMDDAGASATKKGIEMARKLDFDVKVISLPQKKDPADLVKEDEDKWKNAVENSKEIMEFYFENAFQGRDVDDPKDKKRIAKDLLPLIKRIPNRIEQSHWIKKLSEKLDVDERAIAEQLREVKTKKKKKKGSKKKKDEKISKNKSRKEVLEERVISFIAKDPKKINLIENLDEFSKKSKRILEAIKEGEDEDAELREIIDYFALRPERGVRDEEKELKHCLKEIKKENIKFKLKKIQKEIKKAEKENNTEQLKKLTQEAYKFSKKLQENSHD